MVEKNYYEVLEVSPNARDSVISAAYRALAKDEYFKSGDDEGMALINEAKEVLGDDRKRTAYDSDRLNLRGTGLGNYNILGKIAEGGFGTTYLGEQKTLGLPVCIKHAHRISKRDDEILEKEASAIWDLRHFGIPTMRDYLKMDDGSSAIVMSYVPGYNLEQICEKVGSLDPEHVAWITERSLNVLKYLHYHGVVHGDVKPQNIIVQPENHQVVLVDYGLSAINPDSKTEVDGYTPYFSSPEQIAKKPMIPESDFYSLGMTMIYALGGDVKGRKVPSATPDAMCKFIKRLLVKNPLSRPNWAKEDLCDTIQNIRQESFGRRYSGLKKIKGLGGRK